MSDGGQRGWAAMGIYGEFGEPVDPATFRDVAGYCRVCDIRGEFCDYGGRHPEPPKAPEEIAAEEAAIAAQIHAVRRVERAMWRATNRGRTRLSDERIAAFAQCFAAACPTMNAHVAASELGHPRPGRYRLPPYHKHR